MRERKKQHGFSLIEVLMATGILAMGFVLIAMIFPAGIKLTSMAAEKTLGPAIAEEAAAKMRLAGLDLSRIMTQNTFYLFAGQRPGTGAVHRHLNPRSEKYLYKKLLDNTFDPADPAADAVLDGDFPRLYEAIAVNFRQEEGIYPSLPASFYNQNSDQPRRYSWSAVYRSRGAPGNPNQDIQSFVFVCRTAGNNRYYGVLYNAASGLYETTETLDYPMPVPVSVTVLASDQFEVPVSGNFFSQDICRNFFREGTEMVDDSSGRVCKVIEKKGNVLRITGQLTGANPTVWVVPPGVNSQRLPCIGIYESVMK